MPRIFNIHKPTHKLFGPGGTPAIGLVQMRGDTAMVNRLEDGRVVERARAVGSCAYHLTGYGAGVAPHEALSVDSMQNAWRYLFGSDVPCPEWCEIHNP